jgi:hypothetical protein
VSRRRMHKLECTLGGLSNNGQLSGLPSGGARRSSARSSSANFQALDLNALGVEQSEAGIGGRGGGHEMICNAVPPPMRQCGSFAPASTPERVL